MFNRSLRSTLFAGAVVAAAACGAMHHRGGDYTARIIFENQSLDQADVYAVGTAGDPIRIGTVFGGRTDTLTVDLNSLSGDGSVNIAARILATSRRPSTGRVTLRPGDYLRVTLPTQETMLSALPAQ